MPANDPSSGRTIQLPGTIGSGKGKRRKARVAYIDEDLCTGCDSCQDFCPTGCISTVPGEHYESIGAVNRINDTGCVGCFICLDYCRWEAILKVPGQQPEAS